MEKWKSIAGYNGRYEVSDLGNVRNTKRNLCQKTTRNGYKQVHLSVGGVAKWVSVHRLVASSFIPNTNNLPQVNHINEVKDDNRVSNLEWSSRSRNCKYGHRNDRMIEMRKKAVSQFSLNGVLLKTYETLNGAARLTGINAAHICDTCKGKRMQAGGFKWAYA